MNEGVDVSLEHVDFRYRRSQPPVFLNLSVRFGPGQVTAVRGPSGCGKSTLLFLLALLHRPQAGEVLVADRPMGALTDRERSRFRAHRIGFVFQDARLDLARSILGNVLEPAAFRGQRTSAVRDRARSLIAELGVDVPPGRRGYALSGGQAQRIAVCRALLHQPSLLLADEPTGNLDTEAAHVVMGALRQTADDGATVVIATHSDEVSMAADHLVDLGVLQ